MFGAGCAILLYLVLISQRFLPGGPVNAYLTTPMTQDLAVNAAMSFTTTTTWQAYAGENTLPYLAQAVGLVSQNFLAAAAGLAAGFAFIRGVADIGRRGAQRRLASSSAILAVSPLTSIEK